MWCIRFKVKMTAKEKKTGLDVEGCAAAYDELLKNNPRLRMEVEAKERLFQEKQAAKRKEENEKAKAKKSLKRKLRSRSRRL